MSKDKWSEAELKEWKSFWTSEMGKKAIKKMEELKQSNLDYALEVSDKVVTPSELVLAHVNRAKGIQIVIDDIQTGITLAEDKGKDENAAQEES